MGNILNCFELDTMGSGMHEQENQKPITRSKLRKQRYKLNSNTQKRVPVSTRVYAPVNITSMGLLKKKARRIQRPELTLMQQISKTDDLRTPRPVSRFAK